FTPVYSSGQRPHINDDDLLREYEADHAPTQSRPSISYDDFVGGTAGTSSTHGLPGGPRGPSAEQQPYTHAEINRTYLQTSGFGRGKVDPSTLGPRTIHLNNPPVNSATKYVDNHVSTAKYNIATFLPKFLFEQFSKYANLFFLFTSAIQQSPNISPTSRYTTI